MVILDILKYKGKKIKNLLKNFNTYRKKFFTFCLIYLISLSGGFCLGAFLLDPNMTQ